MSDILSVAPALFLRELEVRRGIELLYFGYRDFTMAPDTILSQHDFGRAHHRALYFIGRKPGLIVSELLIYLKITKQSLARVLNDLQARGLVQAEVGPKDRRQRCLHLTDSGTALELELFEATRQTMQRAYSAAGAQAVSGFWQVLLALVEPAERKNIEKLVTTMRGK
jgi:DNA-binding MarR family transcriptional regulator